MKSFCKLLALLFFVCNFSFSQELNDNQYTYANLQRIAVFLENNIHNNDADNLPVSNAVFIKQIGNYNNIVSSISSEKSNVNLFQIGNLNDINYTISAKNINDCVLQYGNNNSFHISSSNQNNVFHQIKVLQRGNNQNLAWYGDNLISEKLKITMQGFNNSLIIKNSK